MPDYIAATVRTLVDECDTDILILGICSDASRIGKPQEETILYGATDGTNGAIGTPMVKPSYTPIQFYTM